MYTGKAGIAQFLFTFPYAGKNAAPKIGSRIFVQDSQQHSRFRLYRQITGHFFLFTDEELFHHKKYNKSRENFFQQKEKSHVRRMTQWIKKNESHT